VDAFLKGHVHASPGSPAFDLDGNLLVGQWFEDSVLVISPAGELLRTITDGGLNGPTGIAIDPEGNYAVASYLSDSVKFYQPDGTYLGEIAHPGTEDPHNLAYDLSGNLYVASRNNGDGRIAVFDAERVFVGYIGDGILVPNPLGLAIDLADAGSFQLLFTGEF
jgi:serine/threonine protein kinase, bacterial